MAEDRSDPPVGWASDLYPTERSVPEIYKSQRAQAKQLIALINALAGQQKFKREIARRLDEIKKRLDEHDLRDAQERLDAVRETTALRLKVALLLAGASGFGGIIGTIATAIVLRWVMK